MEPLDSELVRIAVAIIKGHLYRGGSDVRLPADSWIALAAQEVLSLRQPDSADEP